MGRRGPSPKPTLLKLVAGNPGHRPIAGNEPVPDAVMPAAPDFLDDAARRVWDQLVPGLFRCGLVRVIDGTSIGRYCVTLVLWHTALEFIRKNGTTYAVRGEPKQGRPGRVLYLREHPQAGELRKLNQQLLALEREFGLTPASRTRIQLEAEGKGGSRGDVNDLKRRFFAAGATPTPPPIPPSA